MYLFIIFTYAEPHWSTDFNSGRHLKVRTAFKNKYDKIVSYSLVWVTPYPKNPHIFHSISFVAYERKRISGRRLSAPEKLGNLTQMATFCKRPTDLL